jgi:CubicO group peptidase (beta-lactamase class C family)
MWLLKESSMRRVVPALLCVAAAVCGADLRSYDRVDAFIAALDNRVPELLLRYQVPSAVVSVVRNRRVVTRTWGIADIAGGRRPSDTTLYNVASISKVVTAWGVMGLVERGRVDLDAPISRYVTRWRLPPSGADSEVTVRRLLSHTSGLAMPAVPWYGPEVSVPPLPDMLSDPAAPLTLADRPGAAYHYSGGGYALLQLLIEEVSGMSYEAFISDNVFRPLGMAHSTFRTPTAGDDAATPYDEGLRVLPHYRFAAVAAAGLYTTAADLARLASASAVADLGSGVLRASTVTDMESQVRPERDDAFGYGLGYAVLPLPNGGQLVGHSGSNEGWTSDLSVIPSTGDGLVVLLNRSGAFPVYRDLLCDWVDAAAGGRWPGFCDPRTPSWTPDDSAAVDRMVGPTSTADPAVAVLVADGDRVVYRKAFGGRDLRAGIAATPDTPFYIASLAKSMTAVVALQLAAEGRWSLGDRIDKFVPDLPGYVRGATLEQLLSHTSGVPNYQDLIDWQHYDGMDNGRALALLAGRSALDFPAGSAYRYSNTGYVLVASAIERLTGQPFREALRSRVFGPLGMHATIVADGHDQAPMTRAIGYQRDKGTAVVSDYQVVTIRGRELPFRSTTVGAGGIYSTLDDLYAFDRALYSERVLPSSFALMSMLPRTPVRPDLEVPGAIGHGFGWFLSRRSGRNLVWNTGDFAGHHTAIVRVPDLKYVVIVLSSSAERNAAALATGIADLVLANR